MPTPAERTREDVRAIFARAPLPERPRRCPSCGHEERTVHLNCSACGSPFVGPPRSRRRIRFAVAVAVLALVAAVLSLAPGQRAQQRDARRAERAAALEREAASAVRAAAQQAPVRGLVPLPTGARSPDAEVPTGARSPDAGAPTGARSPGAEVPPPTARLRARARLVAGLEAAIARDARARVGRGELDGPIEAVRCGPLRRLGPDALSDDMRSGRARGRYDCLARTAEILTPRGSAGGIGHPFRALLDFRTGAYAFCRSVQRAGEASIRRRITPLPAACTGE